MSLNIRTAYSIGLLKNNISLWAWRLAFRSSVEGTVFKMQDSLGGLCVQDISLWTIEFGLKMPGVLKYLGL